MVRILKYINFYFNNFLKLSPEFLNNSHLNKNFLNKDNKKITKKFFQIIKHYKDKDFELKKKIFSKKIITLAKQSSKIELIFIYQLSIFFGFFVLAYNLKKILLKKHFYKKKFFFLTYYNFKFNILLDFEKNFQNFNQNKTYYLISGSNKANSLWTDIKSIYTSIKIFTPKKKKVENFFVNKKVLILGKTNDPSKINFKLYDTVVFVGFSEYKRYKSLKNSVFYFSDGSPKSLINKFSNQIDPNKSLMVLKKTNKNITNRLRKKSIRAIDVPDFNYFGTLNLGLLALIDILQFQPKDIFIKNFSLFLPIKKKVYYSRKDIAINKAGYHGGHYLFGHDPFMHYILFEKIKNIYNQKLKFDKQMENIFKLGIKKYFENLENIYSDDYKKRIYKLKYYD